MMIIIFWEMTPCGSYNELLPIQELTISLCACSHSCTLKMEAIRPSETSVLIRATRCYLPEDDNYLHYYVQKQVQLPSLLSMNKCIVFSLFLCMCMCIRGGPGPRHSSSG
jgi:hypothetical protein